MSEGKESAAAVMGVSMSEVQPPIDTLKLKMKEHNKADDLPQESGGGDEDLGEDAHASGRHIYRT